MEGKLLWVVEVTYRRRKGQPTEAVAITTGGTLQALFLAKEAAKRLKVPESWCVPVLYQRVGQESNHGKGNRGDAIG